jgi:hypothetical protein
MFAAASGLEDIVRLLIDTSCNLDAATEFDDADADVGGETALHLAAYVPGAQVVGKGGQGRGWAGARVPLGFHF